MTFIFFQLIHHLIAIMPRIYRPKGILTTDRTNLEKAFYHRVETGCSIRAACEMFGVKSSTLGVSFVKNMYVKIISSLVQQPKRSSTGHRMGPKTQPNLHKATQNAAIPMFISFPLRLQFNLIFMYARLGRLG